MWRTVLGFALAPAAPLLIVAPYGAIAGSVNDYLGPAVALVLFYGYPLILIFGIPLYFVMRKRFYFARCELGTECLLFRFGQICRTESERRAHSAAEGISPKGSDTSLTIGL